MTEGNKTHEYLPIDFDPEWLAVLQKLKEQFGKKPNLEAILFLIGINELNSTRKDFNKEEKEYLMHIAVCKLLSMNGYHRLVGKDSEGWPLWEQNSTLPALGIIDQEELLKRNIIKYFK